MSRRDTIIIAVLINTGMLAILFMMAIHQDEEHLLEQFDFNSPMVQEETTVPKQHKSEPIALAQTSSRDELDNVLKKYVAPATPEPLAVTDVAQPPPFTQKVVQKTPKETLKTQQKFVEVTVKRGDCLGKIALANNTTMRELREANHLVGERIDIGQVLRVPVDTKKWKEKTVSDVSKAEEYYTVQKGDNPWKIAKQFHVRFDVLLKLNNLDEAKARNLKIGDRLRVK